MLLLSALVAMLAHGASPPEPGKSEYLVSTAAGFLFDPCAGTRYALSFDFAPLASLLFRKPAASFFR